MLQKMQVMWLSTSSDPLGWCFSYCLHSSGLEPTAAQSSHLWLAGNPAGMPCVICQCKGAHEFGVCVVLQSHITSDFIIVIQLQTPLLRD